MLDLGRLYVLKNRIRGSTWVRRILIGLFILAVSLFVLSETARRWIIDWIGVINTIGTLLLSGLLVYLYEQQRRLLALNQQAQVEPLRYSSEQEKVEVELSNLGDGAAHDLELVTLIRFPPTTWNGLEMNSGIAETDLHRKDADPGLGTSIQSKEKNICFEAEPITAVGEMGIE